MNKKFLFNDILNQQDFDFADNRPTLEEINFYSPSDDRVWESYIEDINGGDTFADYCHDIFKLYDEEEYYEN